MNYQEYDHGAFIGLLPEGARLYKQPSLPVIAFKYNKVHYEITDLRLLHPLGVQAVELVINQMMNHENLEEVSVYVLKDISEDEIQIIIDIVMGYSWKAKKGGKHGFEAAGVLLSTGSTWNENEDGTKTIKFQVIREHQKMMYEYAHSQQKHQLSIIDRVEALYIKKRDMLQEILESLNEL